MFFSDVGFVRRIFKGVMKCNCGLKLSREMSLCITSAAEVIYQQEAQLRQTPRSTESCGQMPLV